MALKVGDSVPGREHFVLQSQLAATVGMDVWQARHSKTGDLRVFKFCLDGEHLAVLKREVTLYRVLRDGLGDREDLVHIFDWNFATPPYYLECAFGGANLSEWAENGAALSKLSQGERVGFFLQIAKAVAAAHSVGVLHKDLKPANILVDPHGDGTLHVRVADFGSGSLLDPDRLDALGITRLGLTVTRGVLMDSHSGTPLYLAPELIAGRPCKAMSMRLA
jgi:non-specific serine/threonine protein kinase